VLGDSVGAHFSIPPKYFNVSYYNDKNNFADFLPKLENELDIPQ